MGTFDLSWQHCTYGTRDRLSKLIGIGAVALLLTGVRTSRERQRKTDGPWAAQPDCGHRNAAAGNSHCFGMRPPPGNWRGFFREAFGGFRHMTLDHRLATYRPKIAALWSAVDHFHHHFVTRARCQKTGQSSIRISGVRVHLGGCIPGAHASRDTGDHNNKGQEVSHEQISIRLSRLAYMLPSKMTVSALLRGHQITLPPCCTA